MTFPFGFKRLLLKIIYLSQKISVNAKICIDYFLLLEQVPFFVFFVNFADLAVIISFLNSVKREFG